VTDVTSRYYECLIPNMNSGVLGDVNVRRAISMALNRHEIIAKALFTQGISTDIPLSPTTWLAQNDNLDMVTGGAEEANQILDKAGYVANKNTGIRTKSGDSTALLSFELIVCEAENLYYRKTAADLIASQLAEIGIKVNVKELSYDDYTDALESGDFDMAFASFYMRKDMDIGFLLGQNAQFNYGGYSGGDLDGLISAFDAAESDEEMSKAYKNLAANLQTDYPQIGLYYMQNAVIYDANITNVNSLPYLNVYANVSEWGKD